MPSFTAADYLRWEAEQQDKHEQLRHANQQLADFMQEVVNQPSSAGPVGHGAMAMAVVGGINELVLQAIEQDQVARLGELVAPASALLRAAVTPPPETEVSKNQAKAC